MSDKPRTLGESVIANWAKESQEKAERLREVARSLAGPEILPDPRDVEADRKRSPARREIELTDADADVIIAERHRRQIADRDATIAEQAVLMKRKDDRVEFLHGEIFKRDATIAEQAAKLSHYQAKEDAHQKLAQKLAAMSDWDMDDQA